MAHACGEQIRERSNKAVSERRGWCKASLESSLVDFVASLPSCQVDIVICTIFLENALDRINFLSA